MLNPRQLLAIASLVILTATAMIGLPVVGWADTITLKDGGKVEGRIKSETDTEVVIEEKVSAAVIDERTIPRDQIASVEKDRPDDLAYAAIKNLRPDPQTSYPPERYAEMISTLRQFLSRFPDSPHAGEVQKAIDELQLEMVRAEQKEVKTRGRWITGEEAQKQRAQIEAEQYFRTMKEHAARGNAIDALNTFAAIEKGYAGTFVFPDAVELARELITQLEPILEIRSRAIAHEQEQFKQTLAKTLEPQRSEMISGYRSEQERYNAVIAAAKKAGAKWVPFIPRSPASIDELEKTVAAEARRLSSLPLQRMRDSLARSEEAAELFAAEEYSETEKTAREALSLWSQNEEAKYLQAELAATKKAAAEAERTARSKSTPSPVPAAALPSPSPIPTATATPATPSPTPTPAPTPTPTPSPTPTPIPKSTPAAPAAAGAGTPARNAATAPASAPAPRPFLATVPGALLIVALVLAFAGGYSIWERVGAARTEKRENTRSDPEE